MKAEIVGHQIRVWPVPNKSMKNALRAKCQPTPNFPYGGERYQHIKKGKQYYDLPEDMPRENIVKVFVEEQHEDSKSVSAKLRKDRKAV